MTDNELKGRWLFLNDELPLADALMERRIRAGMTVRLARQYKKQIADEFKKVSDQLRDRGLGRWVDDQL